MKGFEGYELIYPEGCKEVNENLKVDELKRRLTEIIKCLEEMSSEKSFTADDLLNTTESMERGGSNLKLDGLLMHLTSEMFIDHEDSDVQLRIAVCICNILKLFCPENPFVKLADSKNRMKVVLVFLTKCLNEMTKLKSRSDKHFMNLYKILSICCQTNLFHWFSLADDSEKIFTDCIRMCYNIVKKFSDWSENDNKPLHMLTDSLIVVIGAHDFPISDKLVSFMVNFLADRCATKEQKQLSVDIISRCIGKLEDQIQSILQSHLIKSELDEDVSDSSDDEVDELNDDFCSMPEYKIARATSKSDAKLDKGKLKTQKIDKHQKNTIETCVEYSCDHTFQLIYEMFKINPSIAVPLLPTVEMKLRSPNNVTDRKRACRLLGKLFVSMTPSNNNNQISLWECFLGRFCDIEVEVREICVRVARDVLKKAVVGDDISGILSLPKSKEDLVRALEKRSHDQEETIRYQLVLAISQIFDCSQSIIVDQELDFVNEMLFKILLDRTRDKCMIVRKEANASLGKLFRRILDDVESRGAAGGNVVILGLENLLPGQASRLELLLTQILRLYVRVEVEDKIVVERLFNTFLMPYNLDSAGRMKALVQCFTLCDDLSLMSIQELFKTQVIIMNLFRETVSLVRDSHSEKVLPPSVSQKLKEKIKRLSEYLPNKDKVESLTKFFSLLRTDKKLFDIVTKLANPGSARDSIVKSISEIKRHLSFSHSKSVTAEANAVHAQRKKAFVSTVKCLLERSAPIIMDTESGQELISLLVSSNEARQSLNSTHQESMISISRALKLLHVISIIYKDSIPTQEAYCYISSIISQFDFAKSSTDAVPAAFINAIDDKQSTPRSTSSTKSFTSGPGQSNAIPTTIEELCLLALARIIDFREVKDVTPTDNPTAGSSNNEEDKYSPSITNGKSIGLFTDESEMLVTHTMKVIGYLINCVTNGSLQPYNVTPLTSSDAPNVAARPSNKQKSKDRRSASTSQSDREGDREHCAWKYNTRIAKLATRCLIGLYFCCRHESRGDSSGPVGEILQHLETKLDDLVKNCNEYDLFCEKQTIMLSTFTQLGLHLPRRYGPDIHSYVRDTVLLRILPDDPESNNNTDNNGQVKDRVLSSWTSNGAVAITTQVKIQALKMLSKWMVTLRVEEDSKLISSVMVSLRKFIGSYGNTQYAGSMTDGDMAQMRLAAGKCWLRLAQVQSFLSVFEVTWLQRLSDLIYDPCPQVRDAFLRKLHKGLFRLQLPLDYMAMFAFVPLVTNSPDYLSTAKNFFTANVSRRRDFLDRNPQYLTDAKLLFAVLPEYVLAFMIHMLAHDARWSQSDNEVAIRRVKQCLWFVMEPILKLNENSSFIRKLLEKIKHAQDAIDPNNSTMNEKLYICCDIALGLLISKQASYDLKEYPVELRLPRTRYVPAPNSFSNPDFANILLTDPPRVLIQFSPTHKSKQMIMNFMPAPLIKGHSIDGTPLATTTGVTKATDPDSTDGSDLQPPQQLIRPVPSSRPKKHVAKIVVGLPEMESEAPISSVAVVTDPHATPTNTRKSPMKRKSAARTESPTDPMDEFEMSTSVATSITKRGRVCKPNVRVMRDMVSLDRRSSLNASGSGGGLAPVPAASHSDDKDVSNVPTTDISPSSVRFDATVSINLERIDPSEISNLDTSASNIDAVPSKTALLSTKRIRLPINKSVSNGDETNNPFRSSKPRKAVPLSPPKVLKPTNTRVVGNSPKKIDRNLSLSKGPVAKPSRVQSQVKKDIIAAQSSNNSSTNIKQSPSPKRAIKSSPIQSGTTRSTRSNAKPTADFTALKKLTKQVLTRRASSIKMATGPSSNNKQSSNNSGLKSPKTLSPSNVLPVLEKKNDPSTRQQRKSSRILDNNSPSKQTDSPSQKTRKSIPPDSSPSIVSRSKRVASQAATDQLLNKKTRFT